MTTKTKRKPRRIGCPITINHYRYGRKAHLESILRLKREIRSYGNVSKQPMLAFATSHLGKKLTKLRESLAHMRRQPIVESL
ncbi:hypothetical protein BB934_45325 (plasmid) [Microvirga ossetica]|uniref:Uncharacterized protein n=1 Tax=Microvirga ossetica TaxID=1882682 RepID=A0A1B2EZT1_9HYPH|nr:hypothetical protein [Microvirga ossetica]ANY85443.1 hypothetical protein BB934_45325 [Microvirga ossetica]